MTAKLLIFGGTSEGRQLAEELIALGAEVVLSVATEYGKATAPSPRRGLTVLSGRRTVEEMEELLRRYDSDCVVDCTHPFAVEAGQNIRRAATETATPFYRLLRENTPLGHGHSVETMAEAVELLTQRSGKILLTTGSKDLAAFTALPSFAERIYPRVLPMEESIAHCRQLGYLPGHIIAIQGPFSQQLNQALLLEYGISILVTKESGKSGGFEEKIQAAEALGVEIIVVKRPVEAGLLYPQLLEILTERFGL